MKRKKILAMVITAVVLGIFFYSAGISQRSEDPGVLLRAGIEKEEVDGDLAGAIGVYQTILEKYSHNKAVAAQAQLRIGLCHEKLGQKNARQAQEAFQKVIDNFPDQKDAVKLAQQKLARFLQSVSAGETEEQSLHFRKIEADPMIDNLAAVSPDGRFISFVDWATGDLAVYDLQKQKKRRLTDKGKWSESEEFALNSRWSPDGEKIVYVWFGKESRDLCVIGLNNPVPRVLHRAPYGTNEGLKAVGCRDWSPDGARILALANDGGSQQIVSISLQDGSLRTIREFEISLPTDMQNMRYSPDGRHIVFDYRSKAGAPEHDILTISVDGKNERKLVEHPADDLFLGFLPGGKYILFASDRNGTWDLWASAFQEEKGKGLPIFVKSNIGSISPLGVTQKGEFCYVPLRSFFNIYKAELDPAKGKLLSSPQKLIRYHEGTNRWPDYSPDGKYLAYVSRRNLREAKRTPRAMGTFLCLYSSETGQIREIPTTIDVNGPPLWSPDGRSILITGADNGNWGLFTIDVQSEQVSPIVMSGSLSNSYEWAQDGRSVYYVINSREENYCEIFVKNLKNSKVESLYRENEAVGYTISLSPEGRWLAFVDNAGRKLRELKILPVSGGAAKTLYSCEQQTGHVLYHVWSADGRFVLLANNHPPEGQMSEEEKENAYWPWALYSIPVEGGEPRPIEFGVHLLFNPTLHPDSRQIAFSSFGPIEGMEELRARLSGIWIIDNILSEIESK